MRSLELSPKSCDGEYGVRDLAPKSGDFGYGALGLYPKSGDFGYRGAVGATVTSERIARVDGISTSFQPVKALKRLFRLPVQIAWEL